jgi:hypothetical protein
LTPTLKFNGNLRNKIHSDWNKYLVMSVANSFKNSKAGKVLALAVEQSDGALDYDKLVALALKRGILAPTKAGAPKDPSSKPKKKKNSKYTAFQKWCKVWSIWEGVKIKRKQMKQIWENYSDADKDRWQEIADILADGGINIRDIDNKPEIVVPKLEEDDESDGGSDSESDGDD